MAKKLLFKQDARDKLLEGCRIMYDAVGTTYSPRGRLVSIQRPWSWPKVIADGVNVAREVSTEDIFARQGVDLIREAAEKQVQECGDGTTLVTLLTYHLVKGGMEYVKSGTNPMVIRRELEDLLPGLIDEIELMASPIKTNDDIKRVATISSQSEEIGELIAKAVKKVGAEGQVTVDESKTDQTSIEFADGMTFAKGYINPYLITNPQRREAVIQDPSVILLGKKVTTQAEIVPILETVAASSKDIFIVGDVAGDALQAIVHNKMKGIVNVLVVEPPGYGPNRQANLEDIAAITNAKVLKDEIGIPPEEYKRQYQQNGKYWYGRAKMAFSTKTTTTIIPADDESTKKRVVSRAELIQTHLENEDSPFEQEHLKERLARLTTGIATIRVGAKNEVAMKEKIERVKDAIGAAMSSMTAGIVPGGGVALYRIADSVSDKTAAEDLMRTSLIQPLHKLLENAGFDDEDKEKIIDELAQKEISFGYDVEKDRVVDMIEAGIVDPAEVVIKALQNAVTIAGTILCTDCLIVEEEEKRNEDE